MPWWSSCHWWLNRPHRQHQLRWFARRLRRRYLYQHRQWMPQPLPCQRRQHHQYPNLHRPWPLPCRMRLHRRRRQLQCLHRLRQYPSPCPCRCQPHRRQPWLCLCRRYLDRVHWTSSTSCCCRQRQGRRRGRRPMRCHRCHGHSRHRHQSRHVRLKPSCRQHPVPNRRGRQRQGLRTMRCRHCHDHCRRRRHSPKHYRHDRHCRLVRRRCRPNRKWRCRWWPSRHCRHCRHCRCCRRCRHCHRCRRCHCHHSHCRPRRHLRHWRCRCSRHSCRCYGWRCPTPCR